MQIELSTIKPSPKPIRTSWDDAKIDELKVSLLEEGQVEAIGVTALFTPCKYHGVEYFSSMDSVDQLINCMGCNDMLASCTPEGEDDAEPYYELVWGHRRVEAARRAEWKEIEAVLVPRDEVNNLIQAGIENLAGEDMTADDKAEWAQRLIELGLSQREISRRSSIPLSTLSKWITYKTEKDAGVYLKVQSTVSDEGVYKTVILKQTFGDDIEAKKAVAEKVSEDKLTQAQTKEVAQAYRDAPTPEVKAAVLKAPIISRDTSADILRRSINKVDSGIKIQDERTAWQEEKEERKTFQEFDFAVKDFIDFTNRYFEVANKVPNNVKYGKYSPEAAKFVIRKIDKIIDILKAAREALETVI
jgi:ParB-like chromosome segregation protein Spo0J